MSWTQPICEACWIERESVWKDDKLILIRKPVRVLEPELERCSYCCSPTIMGVYVRDDPSKVKCPPEGQVQWRRLEMSSGEEARHPENS